MPLILISFRFFLLWLGAKMRVARAHWNVIQRMCIKHNNNKWNNGGAKIKNNLIAFSLTLIRGAFVPSVTHPIRILRKQLSGADSTKMSQSTVICKHSQKSSSPPMMFMFMSSINATHRRWCLLYNYLMKKWRSRAGLLAFPKGNYWSADVFELDRKWIQFVQVGKSNYAIFFCREVTSERQSIT